MDLCYAKFGNNVSVNKCTSKSVNWKNKKTSPVIFQFMMILKKALH